MEPPQYPFRLGVAVGSQDDPVLCAADNHIIDVIALRSGNGEREGDVLAMVTFPADAHSTTACDGRMWIGEDWRLRMNSKRLKSLGSAKIDAMFEPGVQTRIRRRFSFALLPPGINYVLDFSPPSEGAELAEQTVALWLPKMVKLWFLAGHYIPNNIIRVGPQAWIQLPEPWPQGKQTWIGENSIHGRPLGDKSVGATLALGHDDACRSKDCLKDLEEWKVNPRVRGIVDDNISSPSEKCVPSWRQIDDYCPIRHRAAIVRVLRAINGHNLLLNSAPRMWTVAQVAIYLEIPQLVVDPVAQWLIAPPNTKFIEICPERAFQLARSLKIPGVLTASFRILANELAIDYLSSERLPGRPPLTWVGRKRDDYGDFPSDPVEYAARAMQERSIGMVDNLLSDSALDYFGDTLGRHSLPEWKDLRKMGEIVGQLHSDPLKSSELVIAYKQLVGGLVCLFRRKVTAAFEAPVDDQTATLIVAQRAHYIPDSDTESVANLYGKLNNYQRALTPIFWRNLRPDSRHRPYGDNTNEESSVGRLDLQFDLLLKMAIKNMEEDAATGYGPPPSFLFDIDTDPKTFQFSLPDFREQLHTSLLSLCTDMLSVHDDSHVPFYLSDHLLLILSEKEQNFLPIWAEGLDDGSGGVFQDVIPPTDMGPSEPGPAYHTGHTIAPDTTTAAGTSVAPSDLGIDRLGIYSDVSTTTLRSLDAQQSATTGALPHGRVVAASESIPPSERFTPSSSDADFRDAVLAHRHQADDDARTVSTALQGEDDEDMAWSMLGSEVGGVPGREQVAVAAPTAAAAPAQESPRLDDFGLENDDDEMVDFEDDDDGTSTLDGSEYDII